MQILTETNFADIKAFRRGKARDVYDLDKYLLIIASDRISAFDVIMDDAIPEKGALLTKISTFWFEKTKQIVKNHFISANPDEYPEQVRKYKDQLAGRSMLVKKFKGIPLECVVRGYLAGSGWKEYQKSKTVCGYELPDGLLQYSKLPKAIFTPSTKAEVGHDENISVEKAKEIVGADTAMKLEKLSLELYNYAYAYLYSRGAILADTKFEFGYDENGEICLMDEIFTPDSSRIWLLESYAAGKPQENFDKQVLRDYLETLDWDKNPPPPRLPKEIIDRTLAKYKLAYEILLREANA